MHRAVGRAFSTARRLQAVQDPYKTLGVDRQADKAKIKKAYFNLAKKYHPDSNKDPKAKDKYVEVQEAYEILKDPSKKEQFDTYGANAFDANGNPQNNPYGGFGGFGGNPFGAGGPGGPGGFNFEDLFSAFGGGARQAGGAGRSQILVGDAVEVAATISFMEAARGVEKQITIEPLSKCKPCTGSGLKAGEKKTACLACGGAGTRVHIMQGGFQMQMTCEVCQGAGIVIPRGKACGTCHGEGVVRERKTVKVNIPAGIEDGMRLRVAGEGDAPQTSGAPPGVSTRNGDLYVHVRIQPSREGFAREGPNLRYQATVPMTTAALGGHCKIPTLDGDVNIKVSPGTSTGDAITMTGKGMPRIGSDARSRGPGDLTVEFKVQMPKQLDTKQRSLLEQLAQSLGDSTARRDEGAGTGKAPDAPKQGGGDKGLFSSIFDKYKAKDADPKK